MRRKVFSVLTILIFGLSVSACNTIFGLGKDIRIVGEQLEKIAGGGGN